MSKILPSIRTFGESQFLPKKKSMVFLINKTPWIVSTPPKLVCSLPSFHWLHYAHISLLWLWTIAREKVFQNDPNTLSNSFLIGHPFKNEVVLWTFIIKTFFWLILSKMNHPIFDDREMAFSFIISCISHLLGVNSPFFFVIETLHLLFCDWNRNV